MITMLHGNVNDFVDIKGKKWKIGHLERIVAYAEKSAPLVGC